MLMATTMPTLSPYPLALDSTTTVSAATAKYANEDIAIFFTVRDFKAVFHGIILGFTQHVSDGGSL
jgi:hypothetical protein